MSLECTAQHPCPLHAQLLGPDEVRLPNGMAWDASARLMYFVDTGKATIAAFATDAGGVPLKGEEAHSRVVVTVPKVRARPARYRP